MAGVRTLIVFLSLGLSAASACGYRRAGLGEGLPKGWRTIGIPTLKNATQHYEVEQRFTQALVREFVERSRYAVVRRDSDVDAVLRGEITGVGAAPVIYGREAFGSTYLVTVYLKVSLTDTKTNKIIYQNDGFVFRDQYAINARVLPNTNRVTVEQVFSEEATAIDRIARDLAASVVTSVLETF